MRQSHQHSKEELERLKLLKQAEESAMLNGYKTVAGVDEAGRGPLAGPVVCAACIIPPEVFIVGVNDSKQLTPKQRSIIFEELTSHPDITYGVGIVAVEVIDTINILQATIQGMLKAVDALKIVPDFLLVDGLKLPHPKISSQKMIRGDANSFAIAAASIIAKETRDRIMIEYHEEWPHYGFAQHKGYGTAFHCEALQKFGPCSIHRKSFEPVKSLLEAGQPC